MATLVIVPCGKRKIWTSNPAAGPTPAKDAYVGAPFKVNRAYAERFADRWVILSAKYGFIDPDFLIPQDYNVTFNDPASGPISSVELRQQADGKRLSAFESVIALGSTTYSDLARQALAGATVVAPVAGLPLGIALGKVKKALDTGRPSFYE
jgi:hypothetical protein